MWRWIQQASKALTRILRSRQASGPDRSTLMGLYLTQTNRGHRSRIRGFLHQERRDGKFAQNRRRP